MADKLSYDVGKKIVDALKMQGDVSSSEDYSKTDVNDSGFSFDSDFGDLDSHDDVAGENSAEANNNNVDDSLSQKEIYQNQFNASFNNAPLSVDAAFAQSVAQNLGVDIKPVSVDIDLPSNVAVLNSLIAKLPVGVSKQTGALIIKQTMEALGIQMSSVLQEAQQVQENLISGARECQKNILEYKNQINNLEQRAQVYQRQAVVMNDIISLFSNISI